MRVLAVTTATPRFGAALLDGRQLVASAGYEDEMMHAERLFPTVDRMLEGCGLSRSDVDAVACDIGPGSFTGVRVGLSSAKGMALGLGVPLCGVVSLEAMAAAAFSIAPADAERVACLLDARRSEIFVGVYRRDGAVDRPPQHLAQAEAVALAAELRSQPKVYSCGRLPADAANGERHLDDPSCALPEAAWIARIAAERLTGALPPVEEIEPLYVRAPDAKLPSR